MKSHWRRFSVADNPFIFFINHIYSHHRLINSAEWAVLLLRAFSISLALYGVPFAFLSKKKKGTTRRFLKGNKAE